MINRPYPFDKKKEAVQEEKRSEEKEDIKDTEKELTEEESSKKPFLGEAEKKEVILTAVDTASSTIDSASRADSIAIANIDTIWVETDRLVCGIHEKGGKIISIKTKEFSYGDKKELLKGKNIELISSKLIGGANLKINERDFDKEVFKYSGEEKEISIKNGEKRSLRFVYTGGENRELTKEFIFNNGQYKIEYHIISDVLDGQNVEVGWNAGITESEAGTGRSVQYDKRIMHLYDGKNAEHILLKKKGSEERSGYYNWLGLTSKYFLVALVPEKVKDSELKVKAYEVNDKKDENSKNKIINYRFSCKRFASGNRESYWIYAGPSQLTEIKKHNIGLQKVLFRGYGWFFFADKWFPPLCEFVLWLLIALHKMVIDYGVVIIILTILLKIVTYPLTQSSMKSMNRMKDMQPKINQIREKYKGNTQKMNQKIMEFYKKEGINPLGGMGGCLPMILQMPIFISLFVVLRKAIELRGEGTFLIPWIHDLSQAEALFPIGINIPMYGSNFALLPVLNAIMMFFQQKATIKDPNQKAMVYMMPVMMLILFNNFPSGLVLYFTFSTGLQWLQQILMDKRKKSS